MVKVGADGKCLLSIGFTSEFSEFYDPTSTPDTLSLKNTTIASFNFHNGRVIHGKKSFATLHDSITVGDVVGCHRLNTKEDNIHYFTFTLNGKIITYSEGQRGCKTPVTGPLYASVWMGSPGIIIKTNLENERFKRRTGIIT